VKRNALDVGKVTDMVRHVAEVIKVLVLVQATLCVRGLRVVKCHSSVNYLREALVRLDSENHVRS
jgi:hypothetical protein